MEGVLFGLMLRHTRAHIYRAVLEAISYGFYHHLEVLRWTTAITADVLGLRLHQIGDAALPEAVVAQRDRVDAEAQQFFRQRGRDARAARDVFAVRDHEVDAVRADDAGQQLFHRRAARLAHDIADEQNLELQEISDRFRRKTLPRPGYGPRAAQAVGYC